mgnify:CR=1 FL=1
MATDIDPKLFSRIMALPTTVRLDLLEFTGSTYVGPVQLEQIVDDLSSLPVDPGKDILVEVV